jgi:hypothetical protein
MTPVNDASGRTWTLSWPVFQPVPRGTSALLELYTGLPYTNRELTLRNVRWRCQVSRTCTWTACTVNYNAESNLKYLNSDVRYLKFKCPLTQNVWFRTITWFFYILKHLQILPTCFHIEKQWSESSVFQLQTERYIYITIRDRCFV